MTSQLRRRPVQRRSRETLDRIIDACEALLTEVGYRAAVETPTVLLERAGVSRGAFYAYFSDPENAMGYLAMRYYEQMRAASDTLAAREFERWEEVIDATVEEWASYCRRPVVRELLLRDERPPGTEDADRQATNYVVATLRTSLRPFVGESHVSELHCSVAIELMDRLLRFAFRDDPAGDPLLLAEVSVAMTAYLRDRMATQES